MTQFRMEEVANQTQTTKKYQKNVEQLGFKVTGDPSQYQTEVFNPKTNQRILRVFHPDSGALLNAWLDEEPVIKLQKDDPQKFEKLMTLTAHYESFMAVQQGLKNCWEVIKETDKEFEQLGVYLQPKVGLLGSGFDDVRGFALNLIACDNNTGKDYMVLKFTSKVNFGDDTDQISGNTSESASLGIKRNVEIPNKDALINALNKLAQKLADHVNDTKLIPD